MIALPSFSDHLLVDLEDSARHRSRENGLVDFLIVRWGNWEIVVVVQVGSR